MGTSRITGRRFNIAVAFEPSSTGGPAVAQSTFHHFADYNWNPAAGSPSFVTEVPGDGLARTPEAQRSVRRYVRNLALWLAGRLPDDTEARRLDEKLDEALEESFPASDPPAYSKSEHPLRSRRSRSTIAYGMTARSPKSAACVGGRRPRIKRPRQRTADMGRKAARVRLDERTTGSWESPPRV